MATLAEINRMIRAVGLATTNQNDRIQLCAVACIEHAAETNDANPAMRLVAATAPRLRAPLVSWFERFSRINVAKSGGKMTCSMSKKADRRDDLDGARVNVWHETEGAKKDDLPTTIEDLNDSVINLVKRMQKRLDDGKVHDADRDSFTAKLAAVSALTRSAA